MSVFAAVLELVDSRQSLEYSGEGDPGPAAAGLSSGSQYGRDETALLIIASAAQNMPMRDMPTPNPTASTMA